MRRYLLLFSTLIVPLALAGAVCRQGTVMAVREIAFDPPIDALSVGGEEIDAEVSSFGDGQWTSWQRLERDDEQDPASRESNLVMFPRPATIIRMRGRTENLSLHPIRVSAEPAHARLASLVALGTPRILSRSDWGADESLLLRNGDPPSSGDVGDTTGAVSSRVKECEEAQRLYPEEFRVARTVTTDGQGHLYRWPQSYSPSVRLIVVHHTAMEVATDSRPAAERMRALYQYHANNRGWGDIGYHYIIDEAGQIYQGRAGGESVIGGHAYCANVGTVGVALMGNFENEQPTQSQMQGLQWLLDTLTKQYNIDMARSVYYHGKVFSPVVGHREVVSTACPGYYVRETLDQVRANVRNGRLDTLISFPSPPASASSSTPANRLPPAKTLPVGLSALSDTTLTVRPGGEVTLAVQYRAGTKPVRRGGLLGRIGRSNPRTGVWVARGESYVRARTTLLSPEAIGAGQTASIRLKVQAPRERGTFTVTVGGLSFTFITEGKSIRLPNQSTSSVQTYTPPPSRTLPQIPGRRAYDEPYSTISSASSRSGPEGPSGPRTAASSAPSASSLIRIRLHDTNDSSLAASVSLAAPGAVNGIVTAGGLIDLRIKGGDCVASQNGSDLAAGTVRIDPQGGIVTLTSWRRTQNRFRGVLECRALEGEMALINELPLESYMAGLAEEPDTEPYEKQKAFAVAARTYAAYYLDPYHRKFPNQPYDGSDSPAEFQVYRGTAFEEANPRWLRAVAETEGLVLKKDSQVIRAPYFSSDDGRTRSPEEAGWMSFPNAEIFASKPDPWCAGMAMAGHGVGMSGCGARGQAYEGKTFMNILQYYYPGTMIAPLN